MKTIVVLFVIFCTMVCIKCETIDELEKAFHTCLEEFNLSDDKLESTEMDLTCLNTCINLKTEIIKNKKFNQERNAEFLIATLPEENAKKSIEAYEYCVNRMPKIEDECKSTVQLEECVDEQLIDNSELEKSEEE